MPAFLEQICECLCGGPNHDLDVEVEQTDAATLQAAHNGRTHFLVRAFEGGWTCLSWAQYSLMTKRCDVSILQDSFPCESGALGAAAIQIARLSEQRHSKQSWRPKMVKMRFLQLPCRQGPN